VNNTSAVNETDTFTTVLQQVHKKLEPETTVNRQKLVPAQSDIMENISSKQGETANKAPHSEFAELNI